ncbi:MAG TPA: glycosyltransferase [Acidimicrobiales bacterium]|nr:glycosyltransferase [Acidimicrobiales bacterium]
MQRSGAGTAGREEVGAQGRAPAPDRTPGSRLPRVLWLTKGLGRGGTERLLLGAARHHDRSRHQVEVAYVLDWKDALVADVEACGVPVHCLGRGRGPGWVPRLGRLVRQGRFDIVHTHMPVPAVAARLIAPRRGGPALVHTEHNVWDRYRRLTCWSNAATYHRNRLVLSVSEGVAESIRSGAGRRRRGLPPLEVLVHGIDPLAAHHGEEARVAARRALGLAADRQVIGSVGNFTAKKDQLALLGAVAALAPDHPDLGLVLVGSGPLEASLRTRAEEPDLAGRVVFAGSRDDVLEILPAFDVFALSSRHEGLPIALLEAMASGVACVATDVGGVGEVVRHGVHGLLVAPGDERALVAALAGLLDEPERRARLAREARIRSGDFDLEVAVRRQQDAYDEVLARS